MGARVLLVAWKGSSATGWVTALKAGGYTVLLEDTTGERAWRTAKERGIDVVIIDGQKKPSHGRQTGYALRDTAKTRNIPIIWTNLDQEDVTSVENEVHPDVTLSAPTDASAALGALNALGERIQFVNGALFDAAEAQAAAPESHANGVIQNGHANGVIQNGHAPEIVELPVAPVPVVATPEAVKAPKAVRPATRKKSGPKRVAAKSARAPRKAAKSGRPVPSKPAKRSVPRRSGR